MTSAEFNERLQEALCLLSARGFALSGPAFPMPGGIVEWLAVRKMPAGGGLACLHLDLTTDHAGRSRFNAFPTTSEGRAGMQESGDVCELINRIRSGVA